MIYEPIRRLLVPLALCPALWGCTQTPLALGTQGHLLAPSENKPRISPPPLSLAFSLPPPTPETAPELYSVVVSKVSAQDLLFSLARDARINIDVHPGISGSVTLNAIDQSLQQILARIAKQVDMRYELDGGTLTVMPDTPQLRAYKIDYVNVSRDTIGSVAVATQIATAGSGTGAASSGTSQSNSSSTRIDNLSRNRFWDTLQSNVRDLLRDSDKAGSASVISNPETGIMMVRANSRQHQEIDRFLQQVLSNARRQVLIEATIAEVELSHSYQQGVDWSRLNLFGQGLRLIQGATGNLSAPGSSIFEIGYQSDSGNFNGVIKLLESFGNVRVLSTPKISVLNNQTAVLKVVDNAVYFTTKSDIASLGSSGSNSNNVLSLTTTVNTVPIGLVLSVTPQINDDDEVLLNLRPSLSRIVGQVTDPNPSLKEKGIVSQIPVVRAREIESMLRVGSGNIAVMGGLMEDLLNNTDDATPGLAQLPAAGALFQNRNDNRRKTELVIFLRPTVINSASLESGYRQLRAQLPQDDFFARPVRIDASEGAR